MNKTLIVCLASFGLFACSKESPPPAATTAPPAEPTAQQASPSEQLDAVLAAQSDADKARYAARHPKEMLEFFEVKPGMTVVDTLPGDVWFAGILADYLGPQGKVIAADYSKEMWQLFGDYSPKPEEKAKWAAEFTSKMEAKRGADDAAVVAVHFSEIPDDLAGTADVILVSRAVHHWMRMEDKGQWMTKALADMNKMLKPGGIVGVEAHRAPEAASDAWAKGDQGYVKQSAVVAAFEKAGFELVEASEINANPKDQPTEKDFVWRLPPTLATSQNDPELKAKMEAIGESDRMTLKFRKKAAA
ncbi:class I SAM-dependent methyltransferase [Peristeroidobacter agariperforans]|uniref:class I SAM-dependent methyltransferase n=1 Tax=Peristeroidobacter agariperforans TaxID=268404 RepID=UPI00101D7CB3|nr:methyltransferase domain-containing protein [Peristeroidobacter agariperforans]